MMKTQMDKPRKNIREINFYTRELRAVFNAWKLGKEVYNIEIIIADISDFLVECKLLLEKGTIPSKPGREMSKKTKIMLKDRLIEFKNKQSEILRSLELKAKPLSRGIDRFEYEETNQLDETRDYVRSSTIIRRYPPKVHVGSIIRDY